MQPDAPVFTVEGEAFRWRDVVLSAMLRGDWAAAEQRARRGAACARHAELTGTSLREGALDTAGREFRYAHDLVTAQSMEEWLSRHDLTVQDWTAFLRRELLLRRAGDTADEMLERHPIRHDEAARLTIVDVTCNGDFATWARALADRAAADASIADPSADFSEAEQMAERQALALPPALRALLGNDDARLVADARRIARLETSLDAFRAAMITDRAVGDFLNARQLDWMRFDCRLMSFPDEGQAAEAALLLREDGEGFTTVYQVAHTAPRGAGFFLDQIDEGMKDHFLGSRPGDLIGPVRIDDEYVLYQVEAKVLPTLGDDEVRRRAEQGVLRGALDQIFERRVVWQQAR